ncbi:dihydrofolate synthase [Pedobacter antarcticus 4BY]|uniref:Dihydrofolate synthase/folylpolyglutamate synthase n=2 Tax=Pedobacter antarcticus TaxID=34086 RepID=A0A081PG88_9SPHI|nr:Mur ligase family protein [Pedobacter antarcticus]KEQ29711.1 dihydrofolate synthase [Pedobacter antarcticus 4BY]
MTYSQTLDYLYNRLPMFTRIGAAAMKKDLHNTLVLCQALDEPQNKFKSIHIGGTNGKGSSSHMLAAILQKAGYKTGLYTSPHLKDFRERIRINGAMIPTSYVVDFTAEQQSLIESIQPSFFEVTVAMAFSWFAQDKVDIAVIEVGLGGRLDSTNIIQPELSLITNISLDHTNLLGHTVQEIALEKAGIIKKDTPVVIGESQLETDDIFTAKALSLSSEIVFADKVLSVTDSYKDGPLLVTSVFLGPDCLFKDLRLQLTGTYQLKNILGVIQSVLTLRDNGYDIPDTAVREGLTATTDLTGLQGRWQTLQENPLIICDTGHNLAGIKEVLENISHTPYKKLHFVIGMLSDKDVTSVLRLLPTDALYYFCQPDLERALPAAELKKSANELGLYGEMYQTVELAIIGAKANADTDDLIFIGGSTFVVAEAL